MEYAVDENILWSLKIEVLHDMRDELVHSLCPEKFFSYFRSKRVFDADDCDRIDVERLKRRKAELFLDLIETKGPHAFNEFCEFFKRNKTQLFLLRKILAKFDEKKADILNPSNLPIGSMDLEGEDKINTRTPITVDIPPHFMRDLPGPPTPPDEVSNPFDMTPTTDSSTTTFTGNSVTQPTSSDDIAAAQPPPYSEEPPAYSPPPYRE